MPDDITDAETQIAAIAEADPDQLATLVGSISDAQLAEAIAHPEHRQRILDEIFKRMVDHVEPAAIVGKDAVVRFTITDKPGGGEDTYDTTIRDGAVTVSGEPTTDEPKVTITAGPLHFLKLVTGRSSGPTMFMTGKLKIKGDLMFASQLTSFFRIPSAG